VKVLIVKTSALGDVVHALPVLSWLKSADPDMQIGWLVEKSFAPLLEGHPLIEKIHPIDTKSWRKEGRIEGLHGLYRTLAALRAEHYDVVLDLQGNSKSGVFTLFSGAPRRFGFDRKAVREWPNLLATNHKVALADEDHHISARSLAVAKGAFPSGYEAPPAGPLAVGKTESEKISFMLQERGLEGRPLIVLHYGTTWNTKLWPLDHWCDLARRLSLAGMGTLLLTWGSDAEKKAAEAIAKATEGQAVIWPRGSLPELVGLLSRADLVVGGDTGPIHIAAAVGTPTVSLYRVTDAQRNGPRGEPHVLLQAPLDCSPCLRKSCERDSECGASISVEKVENAVAHIMEKIFH